MFNNGNYLLVLKKISKKYHSRFSVKNVSFHITKGNNIGLAGETGSGKSTLLKIIAGLIQPDMGEVFFENKPVKGPDETLVPGHSRIAYLSQLFELPKFLRVEQVLEYANTLSKREAVKIFRLCQIQHLLKRRTDELSGGERQRIALAKELLKQPSLLLLDEPYSNLDIVHKNILKAVLNDVCKQMDITSILVSHDPLDILSWADEIMVMRKGKIVQQGAPREIYMQPVDEYVAGLFGKFTLLNSAHQKLLTGTRSNKTIIVRPEQFTAHIAGKNGLHGIVQRVHFYGSYYELEVMVDDQLFYVRTFQNNFSIGWKVILLLRK